MSINNELLLACKNGTVFDEMKAGAYQGAELVLTPHLNMAWQADKHGLVLFNFIGHLYYENNFYLIEIKAKGYEQSNALFLSLLQMHNALPVAWVIRLFREEAFWPILREQFEKNATVRNHFSRPEVMEYFYQTYRREDYSAYKRWRRFFNPIHHALFSLNEFPDFTESLYLKFIDVESSGKVLNAEKKFIESLGKEPAAAATSVLPINPSCGTFGALQKTLEPTWMWWSEFESEFKKLQKELLRLSQAQSKEQIFSHSELLFYSRLAQDFNTIFLHFKQRICADEKINIAPFIDLLEQVTRDHVMIHGPLLLKAQTKPWDEHESILKKIVYAILRLIGLRFNQPHIVPALISPIISQLIRKSFKKSKKTNYPECNPVKTLMVLPQQESSSGLVCMAEKYAQFQTRQFIKKLFMFYRALEDRLDVNPLYQSLGGRLFEDIKIIRSVVLQSITENHPDKNPYTEEDAHWRPGYVKNLNRILNILAEYEKYYTRFKGKLDVERPLFFRRCFDSVLNPKEKKILQPIFSYHAIEPLEPLAKQITDIAQENGLHDLMFESAHYTPIYPMASECRAYDLIPSPHELESNRRRREEFEDERRLREAAERRAEEEHRLREEECRLREEERRLREEERRLREEERRLREEQQKENEMLRERLRFFESMQQFNIQNTRVENDGPESSFV